MSLEAVVENKKVQDVIKLNKRLGIEVVVKSFDNGVLRVEVGQNRLINAIILTKEDLVEKGKKAFNEALKGFEGFNRVLVEPVVWEYDENIVTIDWLLDQMKKYDLERKDLVRQVVITKGNLSLYINGERKMSNMIKIRLFYYFMTLELGKELRKN